MTKEEINRLAEKIMLGTATEGEIMLYNRLCDFVETTHTGSLNISPEEKDELRIALKKGILQPRNTGKVYRMNWLKWTAAAAVLIFLAGMGYVFLKPDAPGQEMARQIRKEQLDNDAEPGRQGAILTLSNGQRITLDSAANGILASDGGARLIKKDGGIAYDVNSPSAEVAYNTMTTPVGRQYQLRLADGTAAWLNAGSSITYPTVFTGKQRTVKVTGEVYFEVAHNKSMPFQVEKGDIRVAVLGTHFNINTYEDERSVRVTLLEGAVRVVSANGENTIKPRQQAQVANGKIVVANQINIEEVMAWKNGGFYFSGTSIEEVMRQVTRWYDVEVVYNKKVTDLFYAEIPRNAKLSEVLKVLELTGKVHFAIEGKRIIVMP